jgi:hypothetical protein
MVVLLLLKFVLGISMALSIKENQLSQMAITVGGIFSFLLLFPTLLLSIFFILWMKRAYDNLHKSGFGEMNLTSGWVVACWFIPFVNMVMPYIIVKEIWNKTQQTFYKEPVEEIYEGSIVGYWWGTYIGSGIISVVAYYFVTIGEVEIGYWFFSFSTLLSLCAAFYGTKMVKDLSGYESEMMERSAQLYQLEVAESAKNYLQNQEHQSYTQNIYSQIPFSQEEKIELKGTIIDNSKLSSFVKIGFYLLIGVAFIFGALSLYIYSEANAANYQETLIAANKLFTKLIPIGAVLLLFAGIAGMIWMKRAYSNLHNLGIQGLSFQAGMAFWGWFIPIGNLLIPFAILHETNRKLQEVFSKEEKQFEKTIPNSGLINAFWIFFLVTGLFQVLPIFFVRTDFMGIVFFKDVITSALLGMLSSLTGIIALYLGIVLTKNISTIESEFFLKVEERFGGDEEVVVEGSDEGENNS